MTKEDLGSYGSMEGRVKGSKVKYCLHLSGVCLAYCKELHNRDVLRAARNCFITFCSTSTDASVMLASLHKS